MFSGEMDLREAPEVDYEIYAEGEALLGVAERRGESRAAEPFDGNAFAAPTCG